MVGEVVLKRPELAAAGLALAAFLVGGRASADNVDDDDLVLSRNPSPPIVARFAGKPQA